MKIGPKEAATRALRENAGRSRPPTAESRTVAKAAIPTSAAPHKDMAAKDGKTRETGQHTGGQSQQRASFSEIGRIGAEARTASLSPQRRSEIAKQAAQARWSKPAH